VIKLTVEREWLLEIGRQIGSQSTEEIRACPQIGRDLKNSGETGRREDLKNR
jgi:hypothetical protein